MPAITVKFNKKLKLTKRAKTDFTESRIGPPKVNFASVEKDGQFQILNTKCQLTLQYDGMFYEASVLEYVLYNGALYFWFVAYKEVRSLTDATEESDATSSKGGALGVRSITVTVDTNLGEATDSDLITGLEE